MRSNDVINVIIADDQTILRDGLKTILETDMEIEVVGMASNGQEAFELCEKVQPDIVLMDVRMPVMNGVEATKAIKEKYPKVHILILTTFDDEEYILEAMANGAAGYLLKDIDGEKLIQAVKDTVNGNLMLPAKVAAKLAAYVSKTMKKSKETLSTVKGNKTDDFTEREKEIIRLILEGKTNKEISNELFLSEGTVKNYISNIYSKIGAEDRVHAIMLLRDYDLPV